ncbi:glycosyltransferase [Enterorhabdus sp. P55]|uniref:glycosyltransferase family 2 protein n=1 Tax=Enterorhabdus sp. P55 TaxID=2304571 RepID=UPI00136F12C6
MKDKPLVSVIVPVYNIENYVDRCVDSLLAQTYDEFELILVDDGSTDRSGLICSHIKEKDGRVRVVRKENGGLSSARNFALALAAGSYVTFVDGDDVVASSYLEMLLRALIDNDADISVVQAVQLADGAPVPIASSGGKIEALSSEEALRRMLVSDGLTEMACGKLAKKEIWERHPFPEGRVYEDLSVMAQVLYEADRVAVLSDALYGQVFRLGSITRQKKISTKQFLDCKLAIESCCSFVEERCAADCCDASLARRVSEYTRAWRMYKEVDSPDDDCRLFFEYARSFVRGSMPSLVVKRGVPSRIKMRALLMIISPSLYECCFQVFQKGKQS